MFGLIELILGAAGTCILCYSLIYIMQPHGLSVRPFFSAALVLFLPAPFLLGAGVGVLKKRKYAVTFTRIAQGLTLFVFIFLVALHLDVLSSRGAYTSENLLLYGGYLLKHTSWYLILFFLLTWFMRYLGKEANQFPPPGGSETIDQNAAAFSDSVSYYLENISRQKREKMMKIEQGGAVSPLENLFAGIAVFAGAIGTLFFAYGLFTVTNCTFFTPGGCHLGYAFWYRCAVIFLPAPLIVAGGIGVLEGRPYGLKCLSAGWLLCALVFIVFLGMSLRNDILLGQTLIAGLFTVLPLGLFLYYGKNRQKKYRDEFKNITKQLRDLEAKVKYQETEDQ